MSSIYKGTTEFIKVYLGENEVSNIYNGTTLIYNTIPPFSLTYTEFEIYVNNIFPDYTYSLNKQEFDLLVNDIK